MLPLCSLRERDKGGTWARNFSVSLSNKRPKSLSKERGKNIAVGRLEAYKQAKHTAMINALQLYF